MVNNLDYQPVLRKMSPHSSVNLLKQVFKLKVQEMEHTFRETNFRNHKKPIWVVEEQNLRTFVLPRMYLHVQKWTSVKLGLFRSLARDKKSLERGNVATVFGQSSWFREKSVRQTAWVQRYFIRSQQNTAELLFWSSRSTEICIKLFTRSSRNKRRSFSIS